MNSINEAKEIAPSIIA